MEVVEALASSSQIVSQCTQITMTITKLTESAKSVNDNITSFITKVVTLRATNKGLCESLKDPYMLEAAKITNRDAGGQLWTQMSRILQDCERTTLAINNVLRHIWDTSNDLSSIVKQLKKKLSNGELVRLQEQVVLFNTSLQLPTHMITLTIQLRQRETNKVHQLYLNNHVDPLWRGIHLIEQISKDLVNPRRQTSRDVSTLIEDSTADSAWFDNMENFVETTKKFLISASVAASMLSAPSTGQHDEHGTPMDSESLDAALAPLTVQKFKNASVDVDDFSEESGTRMPSLIDAQSMTKPSYDIVDEYSDNHEVELIFLLTLLRFGHAEFDEGKYSKAEDNFRKALSVSQANNLGARSACSSADIAFMLGQCLVRQDKYDEAVSILQPLADQHISADKERALSASHLLGEVYMKKRDLRNAEIHALAAFMGRKELFGESYLKAIESVMLLIEIYEARDQPERAEAFRAAFLKPAQSIPTLQPNELSRTELTTSPPPAKPTGISMNLSSGFAHPPKLTFSAQQQARSSLPEAPPFYAVLPLSEMEKLFVEVSELCRDHKTNEAADKGVQVLRKYDPGSAIFMLRTTELKENIRKSKSKGLAGTGHGFAPLHFFCSLKFEALAEISILLRLGADVDAVAYKAGLGKRGPFTPLSLAVEKGHQNVAHMLLERGATWKLDLTKARYSVGGDRDSVHPLLQACSRGYVAIVELLLDYNMELSEEDFPPLSWRGNSLLHEACFMCNLQLVEFLMSYARRKDLLRGTGYSFVGRPGQQDVLGVTSLMYTVDMQNITDKELKAHKLKNRVACLRLLLEEDDALRMQDTENGEVFVDHHQANQSVMDLYIEDSRGRTVFWHADESRGGDAELRLFLDQQSRISRFVDLGTMLSTRERQQHSNINNDGLEPPQQASHTNIEFGSKKEPSFIKPERSLAPSMATDSSDPVAQDESPDVDSTRGDKSDGWMMTRTALIDTSWTEKISANEDVERVPDLEIDKNKDSKGDELRNGITFRLRQNELRDLEIVDQLLVDNETLSEISFVPEDENTAERTVASGYNVYPKSSTAAPETPSRGNQFHRVSWTCSCGVRLTDDYVELAPGGIDRLRHRLGINNDHHRLNLWEQTIAGVRALFRAQPISEVAGDQVSQASNTSNASQRSSSSTGNHSTTSDTPVSGKPPATSNLSPANAVSASKNTPSTTVHNPSYLLLCISQGWTGFKLYHQQLLATTAHNDYQLFKLLRQAYIEQTKPVASLIPLRTITNVSFTSFFVDLAEYVDLKPHTSACGTTATNCCLPPQHLLLPPGASEYWCEPTTLDHGPPIGSTYLTHYVQNPECAKKLAGSHVVLDQLPKRLCGQLMALSGGKRARGWGLALEEGWNPNLLRPVIGILLFASITFGVLWSILKKDIQGAFGVAAYTIAIAALVGMWLGLPRTTISSE